jgi:hypothetical protein
MTLKLRAHRPSKTVTLKLRRETAIYLRDEMHMAAEGLAEARGLTTDDSNIRSIEELLDLMSDYNETAGQQREVLRCLNSVLE